jgi:hypothetical protein
VGVAVGVAVGDAVGSAVGVAEGDAAWMMESEYPQKKCVFRNSA